MNYRTVRILLALSLIAVLLTACSGSNTSEEADSSAETAQVEAAPAEEAPAEDAAEMEAPAGDGPDIATAAATLGVSEEALMAALGDPSEGTPDFDAVAEALGLTVEELQSAMGGEGNVAVDPYTVTFNGIEFEITDQLFTWSELPADVVYERQSAQPYTDESGTTHWYEAVYVETGNLNWYQTANLAQEAGGYLASITSDSENSFVFDLVNDEKYFWSFEADGDHYGISIGPFLGGYQPEGSEEPAGGWSWLSGEEWDYSNWAVNLDDGVADLDPRDNTQPNDSGDGQPIMGFGEMNLPVPTWGDYMGSVGTYGLTKSPGSSYGFIIEYEAEPASEGAEKVEAASERVASEPVLLKLEVWADNWFAAYLGEELIVEDSVSINTERSFNAETATFEASYPLNLNFILKDFKENDTGLEYIGRNNQQMGDGGFILQLTDQSTGEVVAVSNADWACTVIHEAPLDKACENEANPQAGVAPCEFSDLGEPDGWMAVGYDDSSWTATTVHSASDVSPKSGYNEINWDESAELIWGPDLETNNTILCRVTVADPSLD